MGKNREFMWTVVPLIIAFVCFFFFNPGEMALQSVVSRLKSSSDGIGNIWQKEIESNGDGTYDIKFRYDVCGSSGSGIGCFGSRSLYKFNIPGNNLGLIIGFTALFISAFSFYRFKKPVSIESAINQASNIQENVVSSLDHTDSTQSNKVANFSSSDLDKVHSSLSRLETLLNKGLISIDEYEDRKNELDLQIQALSSPEEQLRINNNKRINDKKLIDQFIDECNANGINFNFNDSFELNFSKITDTFILTNQILNIEPLVSFINDKYESELHSQIIRAKTSSYKWDSSLSLEENIKNHLILNGLSEDFKSDAYNSEDLINLQSEFSDYSAKEKHGKNKSSVTQLILGLLVVAGFLFIMFVLPGINYNNGLDSIEKGDYESAIKIFNSLGEYKDSPDQLIEAKYLNVVDVLNHQTRGNINLEELERIRDIIVNELGQYKDSSTTQISKVEYFSGLYYMQTKEFEKAASKLSELSKMNFMDSVALQSAALVSLYKEQYSKINIRDRFAISEIEEFIQKISLSSADVFDREKLISQAKNDIIKNAFIDHSRYINEFPSKTEYQIALKYCLENPSACSYEISELKLAIKFSGSYTVYKNVDDYQGSAYINVIERKAYLKLSSYGWKNYMEFDLEKVSENKLNVFDIDGFNGSLIIKNGYPFWNYDRYMNLSLK